MIGKVEVERVRAVIFALEVEVAPGAVGFIPARRVDERNEQRAVVPVAVERVGRQPPRLGAELEGEIAGPMGGPHLAVRGRDLEVGRLVAGVRLEAKFIEQEGLVHRVVRQALERFALRDRDRAVEA